MQRQWESRERTRAKASANAPIQSVRTRTHRSRAVQVFTLALVVWTSLFVTQELFLTPSGRLPVSRSTSLPHGTTLNDNILPWSGISPTTDSIQWHRCYELYDCTRVTLPLDHLDPTNTGRVTIPMIRLPANSSSINETFLYSGPIFFNPGGPGGSGIYAMLNRGHLLHSIIGTNHDLISFDPRGVGLAEPKIDCWASQFAARVWELESGEVADADDGSVYNAFARAKLRSRKCATAPGMLMGEEANATAEYHPLLSHVSTASVARDMAAILDLMGEPTLKYWGFSYGTYLGGVFARLFAERVERMVNDGNVNFLEWSSNNHTTFSIDADKIMAKFYEYCAKNESSVFHIDGQTAEQVELRVDAILDNLKTDPIVTDAEFFVHAVPTIATYSMVRRLIASTLYQPRKMFPQLAQILFSLEHGDAKPLLDYYVTFTTPLNCRGSELVHSGALINDQSPYPGILEANFEASAAVMCSDGTPRNDSLSHTLNHTAHLLRMSKAAGSVNAINWLDCSGWKIEAVDRIAEPFGGKTKGRILFIGNEWDNVTPGRNARLNAEGIEGAGVVMLKGGLGVSLDGSFPLCVLVR